MHRVLSGALACGLVLNGLAMLVLPETWYRFVPSAPHTGPLNAHFVRDIGCAYLVCGAALYWLSWDAVRAWPAALGAAAFLSAHGAVHLWDTLAGRATLQHLLGDLPGVILVPALVLWLAWPGPARHRSRLSPWSAT